MAEPYGDAHGLKRYRSSVLLQVVTSAGEGWGETVGRIPAVLQTLQDQVIPRLIGRDARNVERLRREIAQIDVRLAAGMEVALWDALSRSLGMPLWQLLGGRFRQRQAVYASFQNYWAPDTGSAGLPGVAAVDPVAAADERARLVEQIRRLGARGFRMFKIKIGGRTADDDLSTVFAVHAAMPPDAWLAVDGNEAYDPPQAVQIGRQLQQLPRLAWLEEPLPRHDLTGMRAVAAALDMPLAGGEGFHDTHQFAAALGHNALDYLQPDLINMGGIGPTRQVFALAEAHLRPCHPHCFDGALSRVALLHVLAAQPEPSPAPLWPNRLPLEWDVMPNPLLDVLTPALRAGDDGCVPIPDRPGLGVAPDPSALWEYAWRP